MFTLLHLYAVHRSPINVGRDIYTVNSKVDQTKKGVENKSAAAASYINNKSQQAKEYANNKKESILVSFNQKIGNEKTPIVKGVSPVAKESNPFAKENLKKLNVSIPESGPEKTRGCLARRPHKR